MRVLVVEDQTELADSMARVLRRAGLAIDVAYDGAQALARIGVVDYDVVVLDRDLPDLPGDDVCRALVAGGGTARVLMLTASGTLADRVAGLELGADDYLAAPVHHRAQRAQEGALRGAVDERVVALQHVVQVAVEPEPAHEPQQRCDQPHRLLRGWRRDERQRELDAG